MTRTIPDDYLKLPEIMHEVVKRHGLKITQFFSRYRYKELVNARAEFCWRARQETKLSRRWIGRFIQRDQQTVFNALRRYERITAA